ncbi:hypothetical protein M9H77_20346 [Catharanthus roseus]|uniref:Uncharacterized protein n=1 Tax=Catharanthus roseus TaxID=4058 RepID=A0ACC0AM41_CATRO|nr:hypothetical protein M9H77_20346 [Catharanthus roseus]
MQSFSSCTTSNLQQIGEIEIDSKLSSRIRRYNLKSTTDSTTSNLQQTCEVEIDSNYFKKKKKKKKKILQNMSGLVDMWTNEVAKLREKGSSAISSGTTSEGSRRRMIGDEIDNERTSLSKKELVRQIKMPSFHCSEASVSMLLDCFSP